MATIRLSALVCIVGLLGAAVLPACGSDVPTEETKAGTLQVALTGVSNSGSLYRLRNGNFTIDGPTSTGFSTETDPDAPSIAVDLPAGNYLITLADGWLLEKEVDGEFVEAEATLESANPAMFSITSSTQTGVVFLFHSDGEVVELGDGTLEVDIEVDDLVCAVGTTDCGGMCVDTNSDPANCGGCATACEVEGGEPSCSDGVCGVASCDAGLANCDSNSATCETATSSDVNHCGGCGLQCSAIGGNASCTGGSCGITCHPGFGDCQAAPGCETPTGNDPMNCGSCGHSCVAPNSAPLCNGGMCALAACNNGFANCDFDPINGCERILNSNPSCSGPTPLAGMPGDAPATSGVSDFGERRYIVPITESNFSTTATDLRVRFALTNSPGAVYGLEASCDDGCTVHTSSNANPPSVTIRWPEAATLSNDSSRNVFVNVMYLNSVQPTPDCTPWNLQISTGVNGGPATCSAK